MADIATAVTGEHHRPAGDADLIEVRLPADSAYVSVLRSLTATLAARAQFTIDEIEDLRIAVDEACAMLAPQATTGEPLVCTFALFADAVEITASVRSTTGAAPARDTFGWTVLSSLAGGADAGLEDGSLWIRLHKQRHHTPKHES